MLETVFNFNMFCLILISRAQELVACFCINFVTIGEQIKLEPGHLAKPVSFTCSHGGYTTSGSLLRTCINNTKLIDAVPLKMGCVSFCVYRWNGNISKEVDDGLWQKG